MAVITVGFDVGGVLSKYPAIFVPLFKLLQASVEFRPVVVSDMHPKEKILDMLERNGISVPAGQVFSADYKQYGEYCKAVVCERCEIDVLIDDFQGYLAVPGSPLVRLLALPDPRLPYFSDEWKTDGSEGDFGRHKRFEGMPE